MPVKWEIKAFTPRREVPAYHNSGEAMLLRTAMRVANYHLDRAMDQEQIPINWQDVSVTFTRKDSK